jgi:formylglycine-generating enzyme required for sulfatase activity
VAFWKHVAAQLERDDLVEALPSLKRAAQRGKAFFLFDGVDEVAPEKRPDIWLAIKSLADGPYGGCPWLAACRVLSFVTEEAPAGVLPQTLAPLNEEQIDVFIQKWYTSLVGGGELSPTQAGEKIDHLQRAARRPGLRDIARNPMLLTIMALVQTYHGTLPNARARLYQQCVETLLLRWQRSKEEGDKEMPELLAELGTTQQGLERLLWEIAWQAQSQSVEEEGTADIPENQVMTIAVRALGNWSRAEQFIEYTERRAHLLLGRGGVTGRVFTFPHRTFQEYLAASYLAEDRRFGHRARELAREGDYWREVLNLAAGTLVFNKNSYTRALDGINQMLPQSMPEYDDEAGWRCIWLAGEMTEVVGRKLAEADEIGSELLIRLREQLAVLLREGLLNPVQRAAAGRALGRLGDPREDVNCPIPHTVPIPQGLFVMGSKKGDGPDEDPLAYEDEEPRHEVTLDAYKIGKYPVTVAQYRLFVDAGGYDPEKSAAYWKSGGLEWLKEGGQKAPIYWDDPQWTIDNHPVIGVCWYEAAAYCAWLNATKPPDRGFFRLPDEAMWEKAARWTDGRRWPWGNTFEKERLNSREGGIGRTSAVGIFPTGKSPYEVYDCAGNVLEWCSGPGYSEANYPLTARAYEEDIELSVGTRALRGGSWDDLDLYSRAAFRYSFNPLVRGSLVGFRVAELLSFPES